MQSTDAIFNSQGKLLKQLTVREIEVIKLIATGCDSKTTARLLRITTSTVNFHLTNIYSKLQAENRIQAINKAKEMNYL